VHGALHPGRARGCGVTTTIGYDEVKAGTEIELVSYPVTRLSLVKYCGASGDFNVIHWNERIAKSVGLPNVIAHGMFTMAQAGRYVTDWAGPGAALVEFGVRFSSPVVVPDDDIGATIEVSGVVEEKLGGNLVALALTARSLDAKVLTRARAVVRLP
jgi:acyl dehydratase